MQDTCAHSAVPFLASSTATCDQHTSSVLLKGCRRLLGVLALSMTCIPPALASLYDDMLFTACLCLLADPPGPGRHQRILVYVGHRPGQSGFPCTSSDLSIIPISERRLVAQTFVRAHHPEGSGGPYYCLLILWHEACCGLRANVLWTQTALWCCARKCMWPLGSRDRGIWCTALLP